MLLVAPPAGASVLLVASDSPAAAAAAEQALVDTGLIGPADIEVLASSATPSLSALQDHDAVLVWASAPWASPGDLGDVLADYVEGGGGVVTAAGALNVGLSPAGRFASDHSPIVATGVLSVPGNVDLGASNADHPVLAGLSDVRFADVGQGSPSLAAAGQEVAHDDAGNLVVAATCDRRAISVNLHPPALADGEPDNSADAARMLAQALLVAGQNTPASPDPGGPYTVAEGVSIALDGGASSDGALGPTAWSWDFDGDNQFTEGSGLAPAFDAAALDGPQSVAVTLRGVDACGRVETASTTVDVTDVLPVLTSLSATPAGLLGQELAFAASFEDGPFDPLTLSWSWGDGSPDSVGSPASHGWSQPGDYDVALRAEDDDGLASTLALTVTITNPGPTLLVVAAPPTLDEGERGAWAVTAVDAFGDPVELSWDPADGQPVESGLDLLDWEHAYSDQGAFRPTVTASDSFGASASLVLPVAVANVAPILGAPPFTSVVEGVPSSEPVSVLEPGDDPLEWVPLVLPPGASLSPAGVLAWTADFAAAELGSAPFDLLVRDGDGGSDRITWEVSVAYLDADGDGLPDSWELDVGLDPTFDDAGDDPDADGLDNAAEWAGGTDPLASDAPPPPLPLEPVAGAAVDTRTPTLVALEADSADSVELQFEVHGDVSLADLIASGSAAATPSGLVSWVVDVELAEDVEVHWRVRALDAHAPGPWTPLQPFFVDEVNDPPGVPVPSTPDGTTVETATPLLVADAVSDPEGDAISVVFRLYAGDGALVQSIQAGEGDDGSWAAPPHTPLQEDVDYLWTAQASDDRGATSAESPPASFHLDVTNTRPPAPVWLAPLAAEVANASPELSWSVADDPDGDPLLLRVQWGADPAAGLADEAVVEPADGEGQLALDDPLPENATTSARVRSEDARGGASDWVQIAFVVDAVPEDPFAPTVIEPADGAVVPGEDAIVRWAPSSDPDDETLAYAVRIVRDGRELSEAFWQVEGLSAGAVEGSVVVDVSLPPGGWRVQVQATDPTGRSGAWSEAPHFTVPGAEAGDPVDLGPGEGEGWVCSVAGQPAASGLALLLVVRIGRRRRRRCAR